MISVLLNNINRYDLLVRCIGPALRDSGLKTELLICDNGSTDQRAVEFLWSLGPAYLRLNAENLGSARMHNDMMSRCTGDFICLMDNDIELPPGWLQTMVYYHRLIEHSGIVGLAAVPPHEIPALVSVDGVRAHVEPRTVIGTRLFSRVAMEDVGAMCEDYGLYPYADADYQVRMALSGRISYYIPDLRGNHIDDADQDPAYRQWKNEQIALAGPVYCERVRRYTRLNYRIPFAPPY